MPKKFTGENTKAVAARTRKNDAKSEEKARVEKAKEDAYWQDDDKNLAKKQQRKEDQERKKQETLAKAQEKSRLYEEEMSALSSKPTVSKPVKVTKAQIDAKKQKEQELKNQVEEESRLQALNIVKEDTLHENVNKLVIDGDTARTVDEALAVLGDEQATDKHPEKRMKAAFTAFEERRLAELKIEKPTLRLSQLKQLLKKEWLKSPENPLNERLLERKMVNIVYNSGPRVPVDSNLTIAQAIDKVVSSSDLEYYVYFNDHKLDNSTVINQIPGIKDDYTLRVVCTKYTDLQMPENTLTKAELNQCLKRLNENEVQRLFNFCDHPDFLEHMLTKFPALSTDSELISILPKPSLFISILKSKDDEYEKEHPLFIPAIFGILEKTFNSDVLNRLRAKHSSSSNQMFSAANLQQYLGLLPNSSSAPALRPTSSNTNRITSEMFNNALQSLGGASSSMSTQPIQPTQPAQQVPPEERFSTQLNELAMMGFINRDVNIQALLATDGNVNLAVEWLIESGLI